MRSVGTPPTSRTARASCRDRTGRGTKRTPIQARSSSSSRVLYLSEAATPTEQCPPVQCQRGDPSGR
jgi:hypothetical protein